MPVTEEQYRTLSPSSQRALGYAQAVARHRTQGPQAVVEPADLLIGILLAHPDPEGEGTVLLAHFGLTARDVLPENYPPVTADDVRRQAAGISVDVPPPMSPEVEQALVTRSEKEVHLSHLLGGLLHVSPSSDLYGRLEERLSATGTSLSVLSDLYDKWLLAPSPEDGKSHIEGRMLQEMLDRELPRRPVDVPTYCADRASGGDDLIGIRREVDAFAYLLASKAQRPPLAVGLFGDWGSGKSFFMRAVRERIDTIEAQIGKRPQAEVPFWKVVRQIEFNAWEYVRGTLWASLLDHIFNALDGKHIDLVRSRRQELQTALSDAAERAKTQANERARLDGKIAEADETLNDAQRRREQVVQEIEAERSKQLAAELTKVARSVWGDAATQIVGADAGQLAAALGEARTEILRGRGLLGAYWTTPKILGATLLALVVPGVALALDGLGAAPVVSVLGALSAVVPTVTTVLRSATQWTREQLDRLDAVARQLDQEVAEKRRQLDTEVAQARENLGQLEAERAEVASAEQAALAAAETLGHELGQLTPGRVLGEFLQERSRSDDYRRTSAFWRRSEMTSASWSSLCGRTMSRAANLGRIHLRTGSSSTSTTSIVARPRRSSRCSKPCTSYWRLSCSLSSSLSIHDG